MRTLAFIIICIFAVNSNVFGQNIGKKNSVTVAHEQKEFIQEFTKTHNHAFYAKVFAVEKLDANKTQHWFIQVLDKDKQFLNIGKVALDGYLKTDKNIKLNYMGPVFAMCNQGKFVVGFVKAKHEGTWVLNVTITNNENTKDTVTLEMKIDGNNSNQNHLAQNSK